MARTQVLDNADPIALATELRPLLARNAPQAERDRRAAARKRFSRVREVCGSPA
jgi:hypothetical protein